MNLSQIKPGDIIGFSGYSLISHFINIVTYGIPFWDLSHVGIVGELEPHGIVLFESTTLSDLPCLVKGQPFNGSQAQRLDTRISSFRGKVWHYPLYRELAEGERATLNTFLKATTGIKYDALGAFRSGGIGLSWIESKLRRADLTSIFCSEWCAAAHERIGIFNTDNVSRWNPNRLVRTERRQGILLKPRRLK